MTSSILDIRKSVKLSPEKSKIKIDKIAAEHLAFLDKF